LKDKKELLPPINEQIRIDRIQVITHDGRNLGMISRFDALRYAREAGLDLVLIADSGKDGMPVAKIMDFGKVLYEKKKKQAEAKKHQKVIQVKEVKMRPSIGEHDYQTKIKQAVEFLKDGMHVKFTLFFKGRENESKEERGNNFFHRIHQSFEDLGLLKNMVQDKDAKLGQFWSRIYHLKSN